jgi:hypothetical protein
MESKQNSEKSLPNKVAAEVLVVKAAVIYSS